MDENGRVSFGYSGEVGNGIPEAVFHRRTLRWAVPSTCSLAELQSLYGEVRHLLERVHAGHEVEWNGSSRVVVLADDAQAADHELADHLEGWTDDIHQGGHYSRHPEDWEPEE